MAPRFGYVSCSLFPMNKCRKHQKHYPHLFWWLVHMRYLIAHLCDLLQKFQNNSPWHISRDVDDLKLIAAIGMMVCRCISQKSIADWMTSRITWRLRWREGGSARTTCYQTWYVWFSKACCEFWLTESEASDQQILFIMCVISFHMCTLAATVSVVCTTAKPTSGFRHGV